MPVMVKVISAVLLIPVTLILWELMEVEVQDVQLSALGMLKELATVTIRNDGVV